MKKVLESPSGNDEIEAENQERDQDAVVSDQSPGRTGGHGFEGSGGIALRVSPDEELGDDGRESEKQHAEKINQQKRAASIGAQHIRETPDIA